MIFNKSKYNSHWETLRLEDLGTFMRGKSKHRPRNDKKLFKNGSYPLIQTGDIKAANLYLSTYSSLYNEFGIAQSKLWPKGTLCITIAANIAETAVLKYPMCFPDSVVGFNSYSDKSTVIFTHYVFIYIKKAIQNSVRGSIQDNINIDFLTKLRFKIPPIDYQNKIAKVLSDLDAKIELNNKINAELEAMAKLLYDYWFVQFDFPDKNGKPYKSSGGSMVYNERLKREIPEGWGSGVLDDIADLIRGVSYNKDDIKSKGDKNVTPILRATNITGNSVDLNDMVYVPDEFVDEKQLLNKFDILITMSSGSKNHIGKNGFFYFEDKVAFGAFCAKLIARDNFKYYLYSFTQSDFLAETIKNECLGTNINNLNGTLVKGFKLVLPSYNLLLEFNNKVRPIFNKIANNQKENQKLAELRDWLLPMLMNGQVTVGESKEKVEQMSMAAEPKPTDIQKSSRNTNKKEEKHFLKRKVLASYIINQSAEDSKLGETKFKKLLHLVDYHAIQRNLGQKYIQKAAGPYDNAFVFPFFQQVEKAKWFKKEKKGSLHRIMPGENNAKSQNTYGYFSPEELKQVNELLQKFKGCNYELPEIVSTLFAVWNNRIIKGESVTDELLKQDFLKWDKQKAKYKYRLDGTLEWMQDNGIVPTGWGEVIEKAKKK